MTAQAISTSVTPATAPVSASTSTVNVELATVFNPTANANTSRQVMCVGDPADGTKIADVVGNRPASPNDSGLVVALKPGAPDLNAISDLLSLILQELQALNANLQGARSDTTY
jgi:hypothetical protein